MGDLTERFGDDDSGETSLEYGLIAAGIAVEHILLGGDNVDLAIAHFMDCELATIRDPRPGNAIANRSSGGPMPPSARSFRSRQEAMR